MFSKACEYGMRAVAYIAQQSEKNIKVGVKEIAQAIDSPEAFTGKILQRLSKNDIITSIKGPYGGFSIDEKKLRSIFIADLVNVFDEEPIATSCMMGLDYCDGQHPCPIHTKAMPIMDGIHELLAKDSLYDILYANNELKTFWLKRN